MTALKPRLTPELNVADFDRSLDFYTRTLGFKTLYGRPEEHFAMLDLEGAHLMLEAAVGPGRRFYTAPLEHPYGRGINFQIQVKDAAKLHDRHHA